MSFESSALIVVWIPTREEEEKKQERARTVNGQEDERDDAAVATEEEEKKAAEEKQNGPKRGSRFRITRTGEQEDEEEKAGEKSASEGEEQREEGDDDASKSVDFVQSSSLEDTLKSVLDEILKVRHYLWQRSCSGDGVQVSFCVAAADLESALICLQRHGVGSGDNASVSVVNADIQLGGNNVVWSDYRGEVVETKEKGDTKATDGAIGDAAREVDEDDPVGKFYQSIKSRMLVAEVIARIRSGGEFTFDFLMLLFLAGCISFFGLLENSSVVLVASMLVSPLMGPILAGVFGSVVQDVRLRDRGVVNEMISLALCVALGFLLGVIFVPWIEAYGVEQWPTEEMISRGRPRSLLVGILIAVPSGAGVALSVLGGNSGSLVGVAISASLLPPAVNCGLLWAVALVSCAGGGDRVLVGHHDGYSHVYSPNLGVESFLLGLTSFALTAVNIACIALTGVAILKLKEVTPDKIPQSFSTFWKKDVRAHRDYYRTLKLRGGDGDEPAAEDPLLREARSALGIGRSEGLAGTFMQSLFDEARLERNRINIREWVPQPSAPPPQLGAFLSVEELLLLDEDCGGSARREKLLRRQRTLAALTSSGGPRQKLEVKFEPSLREVDTRCRRSNTFSQSSKLT